ncbi:MAG TPA: DUF4388 domain-containing protein [Thermoanaerobaculia bacterium]|nr:DUF4388 domain-containing protein [Thermoanaerobaculia bacterium]
MRLLFRYPPELIAASIHAWALGQRSQSVPLSDYLYHGARKIYMMGEFRLLPQEPFEQFIEGLKKVLLDYCPDADRGILATSLENLSDAAIVPTTQVDLIFRQSVGIQRPLASSGRESSSAASIARSGNFVEPKGEPITEEQLRGLRRISMLLERLEAEAVEGDISKSSERGQLLASRALSVAARHSETHEELDQNLDRLRSLGLDVSTQDIFNALGQVTPAWVAPSGTPEEALPPRPHSALETMRRLVTQTDDPVEIGKRYQELVRAAVERLNEGSLAPGVAMLDLAEQLAADKRVEQAAVEAARRKGDQGLDLERLRKFAEIPEQHPLLRRVLNYFIALSPSSLFDALGGEGKRDRRRLLLLLLEVHGESAREAALDRLRLQLAPGAGDEEFYFRRNMLYLLRRIPRPPNESLDEGIGLFVRHADPRYPQLMVKEAIAGLGLIKHEKAEKALLQCMEEIELALNVRQDPPPNAKDMRAALDRIAAALARFGSVGAHKALIDHAFKKTSEYGNTMARLAEFAGQDLSNDGEAVKRLLEALRAAAPFKLFGLTLHQSYEGTLHLVQALSSTPADGVKRVFEELVKKFPDQEFAKVAGKALQTFASGRPTSDAAGAEAGSLAGDLSLFGVPALVQSLAEAQVSGTLTLKSPRGEPFATIILRQGKLKTCQAGKILGDEAFFQLLERPLPGSFLLVRQPEGVRETQVGALKDILPLTLEGLRRYDEFQLASAIVPDDMLLKPADVKPTAHKGEKDGILVKDLWTAMSPGATPREAEAVVAADSYRIRRMLVHWVEQGSLVAG